MKQEIEKKIAYYRKDFSNCINQIREYLNGDPNDPTTIIANWLLATDQFTYDFLPYELAFKSITPYGMLELLDMFHHSFVDDGEISFPVANGVPKIVFLSQYNEDIKNHVFSKNEIEVYERANQFLSKNGKEPVDFFKLTFLNDVSEFIAAREEYHIKETKRCFMMDAKNLGLETSISIYSKYAVFNPDWIEEFKNNK